MTGNFMSYGLSGALHSCMSWGGGVQELEEKRGKLAPEFGDGWEGRKSHALPSLCKTFMLVSRLCWYQARQVTCTPNYACYLSPTVSQPYLWFWRHMQSFCSDWKLYTAAARSYLYLTMHCRAWNHLSICSMGISWIRDNIPRAAPQPLPAQSNGSHLFWASHLKISTAWCLMGPNFILIPYLSKHSFLFYSFPCTGHDCS